MKRTIVISSVVAPGVLAVALIAGVRLIAQQPVPAPPPSGTALPGKYVDKDGAIRLPEDYRLKWVHLGSWYDEDDKGGPGGMHDVYAEPEAVAAFRETGEWPHGATIVKEIRGSRTGKLSTGKAHWDAEISQWFVMVKDKNRTFPDNPSWGRGWGWGLFSIDDPKKNTSSDYKTDCLPCHVPAKSTDWFYSHGYPILHEKAGPFKKYEKEIYGIASGEKPGK